MKIVFTNDYAKACGIRSMDYHDDCKVRWNKDAVQGIDSAEVLYNGEVIASFSNKIVREIVLEV